VKPAAGVTFTDQTLASLDAKRFEELVAEYYSKTGVVAVRASSSTPSPVHIRISWKGEPRPFACVQCLPNPSGPIEPKTLQEFVTALAAEDIRRGYVVTSGLFSAAAKSFAEQKQLTLMPGDMLLEKLNALPVSARAEIMRSVGLVA
jgi:restriction system protein